MFESAEIGHHISRKAYKRQEPALRSALLAAQYALLAQGKTPVIILVNGVNGVDGAGKLFARVETLAHVCECLERALETKT